MWPLLRLSRRWLPRPHLAAPRARAGSLRLEELEGRCLPTVSTSPIAAAIAASVQGGQGLPDAHRDVVIDWNATLLEAVWTDGTAPTAASRAMAMVQVAVYDAVDAIDPQYALYPVPGLDDRPPAGASAEAAAAAAADEVIRALYPGQAALFDAQLQASLGGVPDGPSEQDGVAFGRAVADAVLAWRAADGSTAVVDYRPADPGTDPGRYELTPPGFAAPVSPQWGGVTPFALASGSQFRPAGPPPLTSLRYAADFYLTESLGGIDSTLRTPEQTQLAHFWADVPGHSVTPPGHWNEIAEHVSLERGLSLVENARLFMLLDVALADAAISCWDAKYVYDFWRPVTAIPAAGQDGNPLTAPDPAWAPLWATPPFPEYTSGHSTFSGAADAVLTALFGPHVRFTVGSDDMPGYTRTFDSFRAAANEAGFSRVVGGIHFLSANLDGLAAGRALGWYVVERFLAPRTDGDEARAADALAPPSRAAGPGREDRALRQDRRYAALVAGASGVPEGTAARARLTAALTREFRALCAGLPARDFLPPG